jgi:DNA-binding response OmpR family regulator
MSRILIIEDDRAIALGVRLNLRKEGHEVLLAHEGEEGLRRALSREDILARCWGDEYEGTQRTVDNFVRALRVKLEQDPEEPRHFVTVRGLGYRFEK